MNTSANARPSSCCGCCGCCGTHARKHASNHKVLARFHGHAMEAICAAAATAFYACRQIRFYDARALALPLPALAFTSSTTATTTTTTRQQCWLTRKRHATWLAHARWRHIWRNKNNNIYNNNSITGCRCCVSSAHASFEHHPCERVARIRIGFASRALCKPRLRSTGFCRVRWTTFVVRARESSSPQSKQVALFTHCTTSAAAGVIWPR